MCKQGQNHVYKQACHLLLPLFTRRLNCYFVFRESEDFFIPSIDAEEDMCYLINTCTEFSVQQEYIFIFLLFLARSAADSIVGKAVFRLIPHTPGLLEFESPYLDKKIGICRCEWKWGKKYGI